MLRVLSTAWAVVRIRVMVRCRGSFSAKVIFNVIAMVRAKVRVKLRMRLNIIVRVMVRFWFMGTLKFRVIVRIWAWFIFVARLNCS